MTDKDANKVEDNAAEAQAPQDQAQPDPEEAPKAVKRGGMIVAGVIALSLIWYLASDRYTPYTDQARVQAYVVGVSPQVSGTVIEVAVQNNQRVEAGQLLFRIDPSQYEIALSKARSDYDNAVRQVQAGDAGVEAAQANLRASLANLDKARKDFERLDRLHREDPGTISTRRLEVSQATLDQSKAAVTAAEAQIQQAIEAKGGDVSEDENTILSIARTGVEKAELDIAHTEVRAEETGVITDLRTEIGIFAGAGHPQMTLISTSDVWIQAEYTENNLGHLKEGTPVEIVFDAMPGEVYEGAISNIGRGISASRSAQPGSLPSIDNDRDWLRQSQRFPVEVSFAVAEEPELREQLRVGGQAAVIAYSDGAGLTKILGKLYIRIMSWLSYAY